MSYGWRKYRWKSPGGYLPPFADERKTDEVFFRLAGAADKLRLARRQYAAAIDLASTASGLSAPPASPAEDGSSAEESSQRLGTMRGMAEESAMCRITTGLATVAHTAGVGVLLFAGFRLSDWIRPVEDGAQHTG